MIICSCKKVEESTIIQAIKSFQIKDDVQRLIEVTKAGTGCRCCISKEHDPKNRKEKYLVDFLDK